MSANFEMGACGGENSAVTIGEMAAHVRGAGQARSGSVIDIVEQREHTGRGPD